MGTSYRHYGWECSPYSGKTRSYLRYKGIPHQDLHPSALTMQRVINRKLGFIVMPVVVSSTGEFLQDSSDIIDTLEARYPAHGIVPKTPTQRLVSYLFELLADEWLPIIAMHYRWSLPENRAFARKEFGAMAAPWLPGFLQRRIGAPIAAKMSSYLPVFGITETTIPAIEAWTEALLDILDGHFSDHPFLLGGRPCLGDFAVYGPLYAHLRRDPGSSWLITERAQLMAWIERMGTAEGRDGEFLDDDVVPKALYPILERMFREQFPVLIHTVAEVDRWLEDHPEARSVPRGLGHVDFSIGGVRAQRRVLTFAQWMLQRPLDCYRSLAPEVRAEVDVFLRQVGGLDAMNVAVRHRLTRKDFRVVPDRP